MHVFHFVAVLGDHGCGVHDLLGSFSCCHYLCSFGLSVDFVVISLVLVACHSQHTASLH
jgi:hypothetical protein